MTHSNSFNKTQALAITIKVRARLGLGLGLRLNCLRRLRVGARVTEGFRSDLQRGLNLIMGKIGFSFT